MCSTICLVKEFLLSSKILEPNLFDKSLVKVHKSSKPLTGFEEVLGSKTKAMSVEFIFSKKLPGFLPFTK